MVRCVTAIQHPRGVKEDFPTETGGKNSNTKIQLISWPSVNTNKEINELSLHWSHYERQGSSSNSNNC